MKKLAILLVVVGVFAGGIWYAVKTIDPVEKVRTLAAAAVKESTGRDLGFASARLMVWPNIGVRLKDVTLSNAAWSKTPDMVRLSAVEIRLVTAALFEKRFEVAQFVLQQPEILLEKSSGGKANWVFEVKEKAAAPGTGGDAAADVAKAYGFKLGEFLINKGKVSYIDNATGAKETLEDINIAVTMPDLDSAAQIDGTVTWRGKKVQIVMHADKPSALIGGAPTQGGLSVKAPDVSFDFNGNLASKGVLASGDLAAEVKSLPALVSWVTGAAVTEMPYQSLSFKSGAKLSSAQVALTGSALTLDDLALAGDVTLDLSGSKPAVRGVLSLDRLSLDRFMPQPDKSVAQTQTPASSADAGWNDTPMDLSGLQAVNLDLTLNAKGFSLKGIEVGASTMKVDLKDGALKATTSPASLLGGQFNSALAVTAADTPRYDLSFSMNDVESQPVLATFAHFNKLSGKVDAKVDAHGFGKSQRQIISSLTGAGAAKFKNGAFQGLDLVNVAKLLQRNLTEMGVGEGKTEFVELGGTFTIAKGVVNNKDLKMIGPLLQVSGAGDIDLPQKAVRYRVTPVLTASAGVDGARGLGVPVDIKGPFSNIKIKPDYKSVITRTLKDPSALKETAKNVEDQIKNLKKDPKAALQGLLGGGLFGNQSPQETPPAEQGTETAPVQDGAETAPPQ
jgi:AsmA protein